MAFPGRLEVALGADRAADPESWTWTDLTDRSQQHEQTISRGKAGTSETARAGSLTTLLDNGDGFLTPRKATSDYYPHIRRGLPVRHSVQAGDPLFRLGGTVADRFSTFHASLALIADQSGAIELRGPVRSAPTGTVAQLLSRYNTTGDQRSWMFGLNVNGALQYRWSTDGTSGGTQIMVSDLSVPRPDNGPITYGWWLDVNDGAGGHAVTFYMCRGTIADLLAAPDDFVFDVQTGAGTTSVHSGTASLAIGGTSLFAPHPGRVAAAVYLNGDLDTGTLLADPTAADETPGASSFTDGVGRTWSVDGDAEIIDYRVRFLGELTANRPRNPGHGTPNTAQAEWRVSGALERMRQGEQPLDSTLRRLVLSPANVDSLQGYWPMEDAAEATQAASGLSGGKPMRMVGFTMGGNSTLHASSAVAVVPANGGFAYVGDPSPPPSGTLQQRFDLFFYMAEEPAGGGPLIANVETTGTVRQVRVRLGASGLAYTLRDAEFNTLASDTLSSDSRFYGTWVLLSINVEQNGTAVDYDINLVPIPLGTVFGWSGQSLASNTVGRVRRTGTFTSAVEGISLCHAIVSTGNPLGWLAPADTAFVGEPAGERIARLCREQGIHCSIDAIYGNDWDEAANQGARPCGPQLPTKFLDLLEEAAAVEDGTLGESRETLGLSYRDSRSRVNQTARLATDALVMPFDPADDNQGLVNDFTANRREGSSARYVDQEHIDGTATEGGAGRYVDSATYNPSSDLHLPDLARWRVHRSLVPELRYPAMTLEITKDPAELPDWLEVRDGDLITATGVPDDHPVATIGQHVEGYTEVIGRTRYRVTVNGSPASPWDVGTFDDTVHRRTSLGSELDSAFVAGTDTSMDVLVTSGPEWTQRAGAFPFHVEVGGVIVNVTAIGAPTAGVQTFTVDATPVNGVERTVPAGTDVQVAYPVISVL